MTVSFPLFGLKDSCASCGSHDLCALWYCMFCKEFWVALERKGHHRDEEKWKLHFNIIIHSMKALPVSPEKSPAEVSVKAQIHANDWNNHLQSDGVVFVPSLTLLPLSSCTLPHPSSQSLFVLLNHLKRPSVCRIKRWGGGVQRLIHTVWQDTMKCGKMRKTNWNQLHGLAWICDCHNTQSCPEAAAYGENNSVSFGNCWASVMSSMHIKSKAVSHEVHIYKP